MHSAIDPGLERTKNLLTVVDQKEKGEKTEVIKKGKWQHQNKSCEITKQNGN
jgi:hypothetical protein